MIRLEKVEKRFNGKPVLSGLNLKVSEGELLILTGPSGCGKSTILRIVAGLEVPDSGAVYIKGNQATCSKKVIMHPYDRNIGMVFQDFALWPHMTILQNITYGQKDKADYNQPHIDALCEILAINSYLHQYPAYLSGGEKQRVAIARALAGNNQILLLDEPMSNIDRKHKIEILCYLNKYRISKSFTTIYVTHSMSDIECLGGSVATVENGVVKFE